MQNLTGLDTGSFPSTFSPMQRFNLAVSESNKNITYDADVLFPNQDLGGNAALAPSTTACGFIREGNRVMIFLYNSSQLELV
jgi:hypothetical protein